MHWGQHIFIGKVHGQIELRIITAYIVHAYNYWLTTQITHDQIKARQSAWV